MPFSKAMQKQAKNAQFCFKNKSYDEVKNLDQFLREKHTSFHKLHYLKGSFPTEAKSR